MTKVTSSRNSVLSPQLAQELDSYRAFRHFSRNATFPVLDWPQISPLVHRLDDVMRQFDREIDLFLRRPGP
jgi:hypothetical protein